MRTIHGLQVDAWGALVMDKANVEAELGSGAVLTDSYLCLVVPAPTLELSKIAHQL